MKRQQSLLGLGFAKKIPRIEISKQQSIKNKMSVSNAVIDAENAGATNDLQCCDKADAIPDCWSNEQYDYFRKKYDELIVRNKKLRSNHCAQLDSLHKKGYHVSLEWKNCSISTSGKDKTVQQASLRKKMKEHFSSKTHSICLEQLQHRANDQITKCMDALNQKRIQSTCRVFNTVYSLIKRNRPFSDIEDEVKLHLKMGWTRVMDFILVKLLSK